MDDFFNGIGMEIDGMKHLSPRQAYECYVKGAIIVDVRDESYQEIKDFGIAGIMHLPDTDFEELYKVLPKDQPLILVDSVGLHSKGAVRFLLGKGYTHVANIAGGIVEWERSGLPMKEKDELISGQCLCVSRPRKIKSK